MSALEVAIVLVSWSLACGLTPLLAGRFAWGFALVAIGLGGIIVSSVFDPLAGVGIWLAALLTGIVVTCRTKRYVPASAVGVESTRP
jgi:hypothetical protein